MIAPLLTNIVVKQFNHNPTTNMNISITFSNQILIGIKAGIHSYASQFCPMILLLFTISEVK